MPRFVISSQGGVVHYIAPEVCNSACYSRVVGRPHTNIVLCC